MKSDTCIHHACIGSRNRSLNAPHGWVNIDLTYQQNIGLTYQQGWGIVLLVRVAYVVCNELETLTWSHDWTTTFPRCLVWEQCLVIATNFYIVVHVLQEIIWNPNCERTHIAPHEILAISSSHNITKQ